jgi:aldose 1-epimerase
MGTGADGIHVGSRRDDLVRPAGAASGRQLEISHGDQTAVVVEVGGGLRSFRVSGRDIVDGFDTAQMCPAGRGQVLAPWPNRLEDGSYEFDGRQHHVPIDEPEATNAIHGLVRWATWMIGSHEPDRVRVEHVLHPRPGYPFSVALAVEYALSADGLTVRTTATNLGSTACPFGTGHHPYLRAGAGTVDDWALRLPARSVVESNRRGLPVRTVPVDHTEYDFRDGRRIGATVLDHAFTDLERDAGGRVRVELRDQSGEGCALWVDESYTHIMAFTGDPLPDVSRRSIAIEPMTCPPNAFRSGDVVRLEPGDSFDATWGIEAY